VIEELFRKKEALTFKKTLSEFIMQHYWRISNNDYNETLNILEENFKENSDFILNFNSEKVLSYPKI